MTNKKKKTKQSGKIVNRAIVGKITPATLRIKKNRSHELQPVMLTSDLGFKLISLHDPRATFCKFNNFSKHFAKFSKSYIPSYAILRLITRHD